MQFERQFHLRDIEAYTGSRDPLDLAISSFYPGPLATAALRGYSAVRPNRYAPCRIRKVRAGGPHALIVVNGFLSQGVTDTRDWEHVIDARYRCSAIYHLDWNAARPPVAALGECVNITGMTLPIVNVAAFATAWHRAMLSAQGTGRALADAIIRTPGWRFTLAGHSLGARVVHFALKELARRGGCTIDSAYLLGGAVGGGEKDDTCWAAAAGAVKGKIYNCYSAEDDVLKWAYRGGNALMSKPIGLSGINLRHKRIVELDCSGFVGGHMQWKLQFDEVLRRLKSYATA